MEKIASVKLMRESDAHTIKTLVSGRELMYRAGSAIYRACPWEGSTAVVCGSGNNAGDGYVLALLLRQAGKKVRLFLLSEKKSEDGAYFFDLCVKAGAEWELCSERTRLEGWDNIADCIFGTGFRGQPDGLAALMIERINQSGAYVVSADINSGLEGDGGMARLCVRSALTVSIGAFKPGHFLNMAGDVIGRAVNADIGIELTGKPYYLLEAGDFSGLMKKRAHYCSKKDFGYVAVIGGSTEYLGAAKLAGMSANAALAELAGQSRAALRAGCGVARLAVPRSLITAVGPYVLESTLMPISDEDGHMIYRPGEIEEAVRRMAAVSVGMGWGRGRDNALLLERILGECECPVIIDADALNTLAETDKSMLKGRRTVLTPHLKEFSRLSGLTEEEILADPIGAAEAFSRDTGATVLLKGPATVITDGDSSYIVNSGCPGMATAGSGDVLSGILTGLFGWCEFGALTAACGAYAAGYAARLAEREKGDISMLSSDTVKYIPEAIKSITGTPA
ncbi:MAG: NAD(P)H-hydrate dehydratase [Oscillospiraceae bacterium]|nr:NAD(P)H-hydrate dehydratase [Oscillospiraceae bacterium]